ncbi:unnamed protein product [Pleuronectes platessa]|uniref:Uncharacterized protein n=1 Tax=Pleuronectes platessa TaxID=8262 RepID=A0A9N7U4G3_PLEPL|nr:unnamed protein product [Pleuronectes platessa]
MKVLLRGSLIGQEQPRSACGQSPVVSRAPCEGDCRDIVDSASPPLPTERFSLDPIKPDRARGPPPGPPLGPPPGPRLHLRLMETHREVELGPQIFLNRSCEVSVKVTGGFTVTGTCVGPWLRGNVDAPNRAVSRSILSLPHLHADVLLGKAPYR